MTIISFFEVNPKEEKWLKKQLKEHKLFFYSNPFNEKTALKARGSKIIGVFTNSKVTGKALDKAKTIKYVAVMGTGFNNLDIPALKKRKIKASNVPEYGSNTVAEYTFALMLAISRKLFETLEKTKKSDFKNSMLEGFDLQKKTLGIIGFGSIGQKVARIAKGFEMKVIATDKKKDIKTAKKLGVKYCTLKTLLRKSDIISIHVPLNKHTKHLISKKEFGLMKKNAVIINTARGAIIDTKELVKALKTKKIMAAGLDVLEGEEDIKEEKELISGKINTEKLLLFAENHYLLKMNNVLVTPHNAFNTKEALKRIIEVTVSNIKSFLKGRTKNRVA